MFVSGFETLERPIYLRIGYDFNGAWDEFNSSSYIASYKHITNALRANAFCNKYVATVWNYAADGGQSPDYVYKYWYPGDEYVDWWAVCSIYQNLMYGSIHLCMLLCVFRWIYSEHHLNLIQDGIVHLL